LRRDIVDGVLAPGERVTEARLAELVGVSRTPIREAIHSLEREGLILRRRGRGTYVAPLMTAEEARVLYGLRVTLESYLTQQAASRLTSTQLDRLGELRSEFDDLLAGEETLERERNLIQLDSAFHWTIYEASREEFLISIVRSYWSRLMRELSQFHHSREHPVVFSNDHARFLRQHDDILAMLADRRETAAGEAMERHIAAMWQVIEQVAKEGVSETTGDSVMSDDGGAP
jgi:DNA-binding GntR family transcriptional regulator